MCDCDCGHHDWDDRSTRREVTYDPRDRKIHPLPKRKRFLDSDPTRPFPPVDEGPGRFSEPETDSDEDDIGDVDERHTRSTSTRRLGPILDLRTSGEQEYGDGRSQFPPRKRTESPSALRTPHRSGSTSRIASPDRHSPPSSPRSSNRYFYNDSTLDDEEEPKEFGLFGAEGYRIAKSLESASSFSTAGLFEGLGVAALHPSAGTGADDRHFVEEEEDGDEDTYGVVDRSRPPVEPTHESTVAATALGGGGSNKKKRKIPGLTATSVQPGSTPSEAAQPTPSVATPVQSRTRAREEEPSPTRDHSHHSSHDWLPIRAPVNPPTTAKAALAKLRIRPPHVSICVDCSTSRRYRRKRFKHNYSKQRPLALPSAPNFVPPAMPREGPPKLPPGSGLKGSKALKAAAKLAKEREKEKDRIRKMFGGVRLPDLYDPEGKAHPSPALVSRLIAREVEKKKHELQDSRRIKLESPNKSPSGYPTPPASSDDGEDDPSFPWSFDQSPPELDTFDFREAAPVVIDMRWNHLKNQKERVKAAKERAAKTREEEKERRREKEEREKAEKAAALAGPPTPAPTPGHNSHGPPQHAPQHAPPSSSPPAHLPPVPAPASAFPSPPLAQSPPNPRKAPLKKGRKKRSAHANAHNVHHRDNYVPSRLPAAAAAAQGQQVHGSEPSLGPTTWPASDEAIAMAGPYALTSGGGHYCDPDEWLCIFCEYQLFYGEEPALYRAVRKRKGVLKVRQKAKERAQKAAQGAAAASTSAQDSSKGGGVDEVRRDGDLDEEETREP